MADVPYGKLAMWSGENDNAVVCSWTLSVVPSMKIPSSPLYATSSRKVRNSYKRLERFKAGKRVVEILKPASAEV